MASRYLIVYENGQPRARLSSNETLDLLSVKIGTDTLEIKETAGNFDFSAKKLTNISNGTAATDATSFQQTVLRSGANNMLGSLDMNSNYIINVPTPINPGDAVNKAYADASAYGVDPKASVRAATTVALPSNSYSNGTSGVGATLTSASFGTLPSFDGVTLVVGNRVLVKNETGNEFKNGIYDVTNLGSGGSSWVLTRSADADTCQPAVMPEVTTGMHTFISEGTTLASQGWVLTTADPITLGTTALFFVQFSGLGEVIARNGLTKSNNTIDVAPGDSSLVATSGSLVINEDAAGAIVTGVSGIKVNLETSNPTLQISANKLGVKLNGSGAIATGASGLAVNVDNSTIDISGNNLEVKNAGLTANKLNSNVAGYGLRLNASTNAIERDETQTLTNDNAGAITATQIVYIKSNGHVDLATAVTATNSVMIGVVEDTTIASAGSGKINFRKGAFINTFSSLTPGAPYYLDPSTGGAITLTAPTSSGQNVWLVGRALTTTILHFDPIFIVNIV